jgi:hypothetical protein
VGGVFNLQSGLVATRTLADTCNTDYYADVKRLPSWTSLELCGRVQVEKSGVLKYSREKGKGVLQDSRAPLFVEQDTRLRSSHPAAALRSVSPKLGNMQRQRTRAFSSPSIPSVAPARHVLLRCEVLVSMCDVKKGAMSLKASENSMSDEETDRRVRSSAAHKSQSITSRDQNKHLHFCSDRCAVQRV